MSDIELQSYRIILSAFIMPIILGIGLAWFFIKFQRKKSQYLLDQKDAQLREQALIVEKQDALIKERDRIAGEMHDDLGGGLTSIKFLGQSAKRSSDPEKVHEIIDRIIKHSGNLVNNMSEIIWAMNSHYDSVDSLISYLRSYTHDYLQDHEMELKFTAKAINGTAKITGIERRNCYLVVKEAIHNAIKYADASKIQVIVIQSQDMLSLKVADNGIGISAENEFGNGLRNMQNRMKEIGGNLDIVSADGQGTTLLASFNYTKHNNRA